MKLLFQADDFGLCESTACGIMKGIRKGIIRNTGLFVNMPSSEYAANLIRDVDGIALGIDFNLVAGKPVSNSEDVGSLITETGDFISSKVRTEQMLKTNQDPYLYDETLLELENQYHCFVELIGRKPDYLHGHSLITPTIIRVIRELGQKYNVPVSFDIWKEKNVYCIESSWTPKPFLLEDQIKTNVEENLLKVLPDALQHDLCMFICHAGFVEEELFKYSSYTMIRAKDLMAATSDKVKEFINQNNVELITYKDLKELI